MKPSAPLKLGWCVSGRGTLLQAILQAIELQLLHCSLCLVIMDRPSEIEEICERRGVRTVRVAPPAEDNRGAFDESMCTHLHSAGPEWLGLTFNRLLGSSVISLMRGRVFNLHMSLLPAFPGFFAIPNAIDCGVKISGVTLHLVDESIDRGSILAQAACVVHPSDTRATLGFRLFRRAVPLTLQVIRAIETARCRLSEELKPQWSPPVTAIGEQAVFPPIDEDIAVFAEEFCNLREPKSH